MPLIDMINGMAGAANEHNTNLFNMAEEQKKDLSAQYSKIVEDPNTPPEVQQEAANRMIGLHTLAPGKKVPKEWSEFSFVVQPKAPPSTQLPAPQAAVPGLQPTMETPAPITAPTPPPQTMNMGMKIPYSQMTGMMAERQKAMSDASYHPPVDNSLGDWEFYFKAAGGDAEKARQMRKEDKIAEQKVPAFNFPKPITGADLRGMLRNAGQPEVDAGGTPIDDAGSYNVRHTGASIVATADTPRFGAVKFAYNPSAGQWVGYQTDQRGNSKITQQLGGSELIPPQGVPREAVQNKVEFVPQEDGSIKEVPYQTLTVTTRGGTQAPAPTPPPGGVGATAPKPPQSNDGVVGGRSLSPEQAMVTLQKGEAFSNTIDRMVGILGKMGGMEGLIARGKASVMANPDGTIKLVFANGFSPSDSDAKFAADYQSLGEDINVLRGTYQATGFRGPEAFQMLMNQRGNLLGNPKVFKETLRNSLQSVVTQLKPMRQEMEKAGRPMELTDGIVHAYTILNDGDEKKTLAALKKDGWVK